MPDGQTHVRGTHLRQQTAVPEADERMHHGLRMHGHTKGVRRNAV